MYFFIVSKHHIHKLFFNYNNTLDNDFFNRCGSGGEITGIRLKIYLFKFAKTMQAIWRSSPIAVNKELSALLSTSTFDATRTVTRATTYKNIDCNLYE